MTKFQIPSIIHFICGDVFLPSDDRPAYVAAKMRDYTRCDPEFSLVDLDSLSRAESARLPVAEDSSVPAFGAAATEEIDGLKACILRTLRHTAPLLADETLLADRFTFLTVRHRSFDAGTVVLERSTNRAMLYYLIPSARLNAHGGLVLQYRSPDSVIPRLLATAPNAFRLSTMVRGTATTTASKIADELTKQYLIEKGVSKLAQGVLGAISGGLATLILGEIFDLVFPPGESFNFFNYLPALERIVRQEIQLETINRIQSTFQRIVAGITNDYQPIRNDSTPLSDPTKNNELYRQILHYIDDLDSAAAMATLQSARYQQIGLPVFLFGATLHLALLQEKANVVWSRSQEIYSDLTKDQGTIEKWAKEYHQWVLGGPESAWPQVKAARRAQISAELASQCHRGGANSVACTNNVEVRDAGAVIISYNADDHKGSTAPQQANDYIQFYYWPEQLDDLAQSLSLPRLIAEAWQTLVTNPMGASAGTWPPPKAAAPAGTAYYIMLGTQDRALTAGAKLFSEDEKTFLLYRNDGNLVLCTADNKVLWSSQTSGPPGCARMQTDGNFVIYTASVKLIWQTNTVNHPDAYALVTDDGHFQIRSTINPGGPPLWSAP